MDMITSKSWFKAIQVSKHCKGKTYCKNGNVSWSRAIRCCGL